MKYHHPHVFDVCAHCMVLQYGIFLCLCDLISTLSNDTYSVPQRQTVSPFGCVPVQELPPLKFTFHLFLG